MRNRAGTAIVTAQACTEVGGGFYRYTLSSGSNTAEDMLSAVFTTSDTTVDQRDIPALWAIQKGGIENLDAAVSSRNSVAPDNASLTTLTGRLTSTRAGLLDNLDAAVSSRLASGSYTAPDNANIAVLIARLTSGRAALLDNLSRLDIVVSTLALATDVGALITRLTSTRAGYLDNLANLTAVPPTAVQVADAILDADATTHNTASTVGSFLAKLDAAVSSRLPDNLTAIRNAVWNTLPIFTGSTWGQFIQDRLDATISSRNAVAPDNASLTTLTGRLTSGRAANLDNLDAAISTRATLAAQTLNAADLATLLTRLTNTRAALLDNLSRLDVAVSSVSGGGGGGGGATAGEIADAVLDELLSAHTTAGSLSKSIADLIAAVGQNEDPLTNPVAGYAAGTAGAALARIGPAQIVVRSPVGTTGDVRIVIGADYRAANGNALEFTSTDWPDLTDAVDARMIVYDPSIPDGGEVVFDTAITSPINPGRVVVEIEAVVSAQLTPGSYRYVIDVTLTGEIHLPPLVTGTLVAS